MGSQAQAPVVFDCTTANSPSQVKHDPGFENLFGYEWELSKSPIYATCGVDASWSDSLTCPIRKGDPPKRRPAEKATRQRQPHSRPPAAIARSWSLAQ